MALLGVLLGNFVLKFLSVTPLFAFPPFNFPKVERFCFLLDVLITNNASIRIFDGLDMIILTLTAKCACIICGKHTGDASASTLALY